MGQYFFIGSMNLRSISSVIFNVVKFIMWIGNCLNKKDRYGVGTRECQYDTSRLPVVKNSHRGQDLFGTILKLTCFRWWVDSWKFMHSCSWFRNKAWSWTIGCAWCWWRSCRHVSPRWSHLLLGLERAAHFSTVQGNQIEVYLYILHIGFNMHWKW